MKNLIKLGLVVSLFCTTTLVSCQNKPQVVETRSFEYNYVDYERPYHDINEDGSYYMDSYVMEYYVNLRWSNVGFERTMDTCLVMLIDDNVARKFNRMVDRYEAKVEKAHPDRYDGITIRFHNKLRRTFEINTYDNGETKLEFIKY